MEQPRAGDEFRAMQCGRRMFLTALILASKYLQDRNYSTRAWSKISGLRAQEIHQNEMEYCKKINWALHFPKEKFDRWSYTVLRLSSPMGGPKSDTVAQVIGWSRVLSKLDARLSETFPTREDFISCQSLSTLMPSNFVFGETISEQRSTENNKTESSHTSAVKINDPQPPPTAVISQPPQPRLSKLPTPQSTPHPNPFNTFSTMAGTPSMCAAMSQVRNQGLIRVTRDHCPPPQACSQRWTGSQSCLSRMTSAAASPSESISSEPPPLVHSRGSRSSSISSSTSGVSVTSAPSKNCRYTPSITASFSKEHGCIQEPFIPSLTRSNDQYLAGMISDLENCTSSPESCDQRSMGKSSPFSEKVIAISQVPTAYSSKAYRPEIRDDYLSSRNMHIQDWEAAETLCRLPSNQSSAWSTPQPTNASLPTLSRSVSATDYNDQLTPRASCTPAYRKENVSPSTCHKRTHSKTNDLQDQVRQQLRKASWQTDMADRTINPSSRKIPCSSPTQTFGVKQFPVPTKSSEGYKRYCAYQATAADRAASMLLADHLRGRSVR